MGEISVKTTITGFDDSENSY